MAMDRCRHCIDNGSFVLSSSWTNLAKWTHDGSFSTKYWQPLQLSEGFSISNFRLYYSCDRILFLQTWDKGIIISITKMCLAPNHFDSTIFSSPVASLYRVWVENGYDEEEQDPFSLSIMNICSCLSTPSFHWNACLFPSIWRRRGIELLGGGIKSRIRRVRSRQSHL